jgi:hypothetical protein
METEDSSSHNLRSCRCNATSAGSNIALAPEAISKTTRNRAAESLKPGGGSGASGKALLGDSVDGVPGFVLRGLNLDAVLLACGGDDPRTPWACQSVAFMISASVAPFARPINSRIFAPLLSARPVPQRRRLCRWSLRSSCCFGTSFSALASRMTIHRSGTPERQGKSDRLHNDWQRGERVAILRQRPKGITRPGGSPSRAM